MADDDAGNDVDDYSGGGDDAMMWIDDQDGSDDGLNFGDDDTGLEGKHWAEEDDQFQDNNFGDDLYDIDDAYYEGYDGPDVPGHDTTTTTTAASFPSATAFSKGSTTETVPQQKLVATPTARSSNQQEHPILLVFLLVGIALVLTLQNIVKRSSPSAMYKRDDGDSLPLVKVDGRSNGATAVNGKKK